MLSTASAAEAITLAASRLERETADLERVASRSGTQSTCLVLAPAGSSELVVLKVMSPAYPHTSPLAAQREYRALERLYEATAVRSDVSVPEPLACFPDATAYLMRYVDGVPIADLVGRRLLDASASLTIARRLVAGLRLFHEALGSSFGDLHPGNILVERDSLRLTFIDPTAPNPAYYEIAEGARFGPLAADLGYWCFSVAAVTSRYVPLRAARRRDLVRLTVAALAEAGCGVTPGDRSAFRADVFAIAHQYRELVRASGAVKGRLLSAALGVELALLERRAGTPS